MYRATSSTASALTSGACRAHSGRSPSHDSAGNNGDVTPMSPLYAPAVCCIEVRRAGLPSEATDGRLAGGSVPDTIRARPEMPSLLVSFGSSFASSVASGIASSRPSPKFIGATRGLNSIFFEIGS